MKFGRTLTHEFVEHLPDELTDGIIYISIPYATVAHKCCCGCGHEVVTPLSPTDWELTFDGRTVSLDPSIGNWSFPCQSHYWIIRNTVRWSRPWSQKEIEKGRARDRLAKKRYSKTEATSKIEDGIPGARQ
jgi:hypothetical protein